MNNNTGAVDVNDVTLEHEERLKELEKRYIDILFRVEKLEAYVCGHSEFIDYISVIGYVV